MYLGGNWECQDARKSAFPYLFGGKLGMSRFQKKCIAESVWVEMGQVQISEKANVQVSGCLGVNGTYLDSTKSGFPTLTL